MTHGNNLPLPSRFDVYNVRRLITDLAERGVQVWHNRGKVYAGPLDRIDQADRALLGAATEEVIAYLQEEPYPLSSDPRELIAPCPVLEGSYAGKLVRKPWEYELSVILPTFGQLDLVEAAVACWRRQSVTPYLIIVDTGGEDEAERDLEQLRDVDCEIHYIAAHGWRHSSAPVSAALDLAGAVCQTNVAVYTHVDVFPKRTDVLAELVARLSPSCPVLGYRMTPRMGSAEWHGCVSHTLTAVDMRTIRRIGASWNLLGVLEADGELEQMYFGWPDTETAFNRCLRRAGIVPEFLGDEANVPVWQSDLVVHWRSAPSLRHYDPLRAARQLPGLEQWLARTAALGVAAELPDVAGDQAELPAAELPDVAGDLAKTPAPRN